MCVRELFSPLCCSLLAFSVSTQVLKNIIYPKVFLLCLELTYCTDSMRARQEILCYMKVLIHQTPRLQSQRCTPWCLQWQSTHAMDVCRNATSMQLSRKDPAEEAGVDCIPTHKSQHILSGCLLGAKFPLTILLIQWKYDPPCNSVTWLLCVQAALLFNTTTTTTTTTSFNNDNNNNSKNC